MSARICQCCGGNGYEGSDCSRTIDSLTDRLNQAVDLAKALRGDFGDEAWLIANFALEEILSNERPSV
jgi:hypothetical protein